MTKAFRDEYLNDTLFTSLRESRSQITSRKGDHNRNRHHSSPDNLAACGRLGNRLPHRHTPGA
ncbi:integrase core domain-containing protein [Labrenzia sp. R5_0]|uniref:integrase core domain-containing protein n=1 Tax=Labrenzia sp. R5_0 TaxID=2821108 RepID=UPI00336BCE0E